MKLNFIKYICIALGFLVTKSALACDPVVNLGSLISFCQGNSISLNAYNPNSTYVWNTGANTSSITVSSSGIYWVAVTNNCGTTRDTVEIVVDQLLNLNLGGDQEVCVGGSYIIQPPYSVSHSYLWQDGSVGSFYQVTSPGLYWVEITNSCGVYRDSIQITYVNLPNLDLGPDTVICNNNPITISAGNVGYPVTWSTGQTVNSINFNFSATFWAETSNACGTIRDSISVYYSEPPNLGDTVWLCNGGVLRLDASRPVGTYNWDNGATTPFINVTQAGQYWVKYTNPCGVFYDTVEVVLTGPANVNLGPDTAICIGQYIDLNAGYSGSAYQWFRKDAAQQFVLIDSLQTLRVDTTGIYVAAIDNGCGWRYDTIDVEVLEIPTQVFGDTVGVCQGSTRTLDAGYWGKSAAYLWDDGSINRTNTLSTPGSHSVLITNPCGTYLNNFYLRYDQTYSIDLGPDDTVCDAQYIIDLNLNLTQTDTILWSNGVDKPVNTVSHTGTYWVRVTNDCGIYTDTIEILFLNPPSISFDDFSVCAGGGHTLSVVPKPGTSHLWSTGDTTSSINITQSGTYWARSYNKCDTVSDTVQVSFDQPINFSLGPDVTICEPGIAVLSAGNIGLLGADSIRWSTGSKNSVLVVSTSGTYIAKLYNSCGIFTDTVNVTINKLPVSKLSNTAFCVGGGIVLDADQNAPNTTYYWNTGVSTTSINVTTPGQYWVEITNDCGTIVDSVYVREDYPLPQINLGNDTIFCQGVLWLDPGYVAGATYLWQNGFTSQAFVVAQSGQYHVKMENGCGAVYDTINVLITGPPQPTLGSLVHFCSGHSLVLNAENPGCKYKWSTGDSTQQILISSPGVYSVEISNDCGSITDSVEVRIEYPIENLDLGPDTIICLGQQLILDPGYSGVRRLWSNGTGWPTFTVNQTGLYWVDLFNSCGVFSDSIYVEVQGLPVFSLGNDTVICSINGQLDLYGPPGMIDYEWSNGGSNQSTRFTTSGKHWLKVTNSCFSYTDTILVVEEYPLILDLGPDTAVCETETYILDAGIYNYPVYWNDQSISAIKEVKETGWYWAYAQNSCGFVSDSVYVQIDTIVGPVVIDTILCDEDSLTLDLSDYLYDFVWFDGSTEKIRTFSDEGVYPITLFNRCGVFEREFEVIFSDCDCPVYIANSFTPNGDQLNDEFKVLNNCLIEDYSIQIFSRWGARVFYSEDPDATWNGVFDGKIMPSGVYTYKVYYKWKVYQLDRHKTRHGMINLIR